MSSGFTGYNYTIIKQYKDTMNNQGCILKNIYAK